MCKLAASLRVVAHDELIIFSMESMLDVADLATRREVPRSLLIRVQHGMRIWASALGRQPIVSADNPAASMWAGRCKVRPGIGIMFPALAMVAYHLIWVMWAFSGTSVNVCKLAATIRVVAHYELIVFSMESVLDVADVASRREVAWSWLVWVL